MAMHIRGFAKKSVVFQNQILAEYKVSILLPYNRVIFIKITQDQLIPVDIGASN